MTTPCPACLGLRFTASIEAGVLVHRGCRACGAQQKDETMGDEQIIAALKAGKRLNFGCNGHNGEVMDLMHRLEEEGLIRTEDASLSQETRRSAVWIAPTPPKEG